MRAPAEGEPAIITPVPPATPDTDPRRRAIRRALLVVLALNLAAAAVKVAAAWASGSLALAAGAADSLFDGGANLVGLAAMRVAGRPPDEGHPYGHRKFETLVAVGIAGTLFVTCLNLVWRAAASLASGRPGPTVTLFTLGAPALAVLLNAAAATYEGRRGRALASDLLLADAGHTRADAWASLALVVGLVAVGAGYPIVDPLLALAIAGVVARVGWGIVRETSAVLADAAALDPEAVGRIASSVEGVEGVHKVRSRGPADAVALDLHVQVDPALGIGRAHAIGHAVQAALRAALPGLADVVVHVEPEWALAGDEVSRAVRRVVGRFPVEAHEIHVHGAGRLEVSLHLELEPTLSLEAAHRLASAVEAAVRAEVPGAEHVVTHLEPRADGPAVADEPADLAAYRTLVGLETRGVAGLSGPHDVQAARVPGGIRLSAHVCAPGDLPLARAHALAEALEARLRAAEPALERITIHVEPGPPDSESDQP